MPPHTALPFGPQPLAAVPRRLDVQCHTGSPEQEQEPHADHGCPAVVAHRGHDWEAAAAAAAVTQQVSEGPAGGRETAAWTDM